MDLAEEIPADILDAIVGDVTDGTLGSIGNLIFTSNNGTSGDINTVLKDLASIQKQIDTLTDDFNKFIANYQNTVVNDQLDKIYGVSGEATTLYSAVIQSMINIQCAVASSNKSDCCKWNSLGQSTKCDFVVTGNTQFPAPASSELDGLIADTYNTFVSNFYPNGVKETTIIVGEMNTLLSELAGDPDAKIEGLLTMIVDAQIKGNFFSLGETELKGTYDGLLSTYQNFAQFFVTFALLVSAIYQYNAATNGTSQKDANSAAAGFVSGTIAPALATLTGCFLMNVERLVLSQFDGESASLTKGSDTILEGATWLAILNTSQTPTNSYQVLNPKVDYQGGLFVRAYVHPSVIQNAEPKLKVSIANSSASHTFSPSDLNWTQVTPTETSGGTQSGYPIMVPSWLSILAYDANGKIADFNDSKAVALYGFLSLDTLKDKLGKTMYASTELDLNLLFDAGIYRESYNYDQKGVTFGNWDTSTGASSKGAGDSTVLQAFACIQGGLNCHITEAKEIDSFKSSTDTHDPWSSSFETIDSDYPAKLIATVGTSDTNPTPSTSSIAYKAKVTIPNANSANCTIEGRFFLDYRWRVRPGLGGKNNTSGIQTVTIHMFGNKLGTTKPETGKVSGERSSVKMSGTHTLSDDSDFEFYIEIDTWIDASHSPINEYSNATVKLDGLSFFYSAGNYNTYT
ncbi:hypothetical protein [Kordiimonas sp.]|uniref:hypothetical protein n=1 Tax=Kordiimonas sp. TaxID=1970157 RepID=UPI003A90F30C